jgi:hypothetical protein
MALPFVLISHVPEVAAKVSALVDVLHVIVADVGVIVNPLNSCTVDKAFRVPVNPEKVTFPALCVDVVRKVRV